MHRNNLSHEFLLFYLGHSMKSRRSQSIRIKGFFNRRNLFNRKLNTCRFLQRSRNALMVNVNINIINTVVKAAKRDKLNKDLFVLFPNSTKEGCYQKNYLCSHIVPPSVICGYARLLVENVCSVLQSSH